MTRNQLKQIIKECLIEILAEGMGSDLQENVSRVPRRTNPQVQARAPRPGLENTKYGVQQQQQRQQQIRQTVNQVTRDPIMASIFADTMQTTLLEQQAADNQTRSMGSGGGYTSNVHTMLAGGGQPPVQRQQYQSNDEPINETYARWSDAAFSSRGSSPASMMMDGFAQEMEQMNREIK